MNTYEESTRRVRILRAVLALFAAAALLLMCLPVQARADGLQTGGQNSGETAGNSQAATAQTARIIGSEKQYMNFYYLDEEGKSGRKTTVLFSVEIGGKTYRAYCLESTVTTRFGEARVGTWEEFPGTNNFKDDPQVREKVAWIVANSYPTVPLDQLAERIGQPGLTEAEAVAATQAAIWTYTDGYSARGFSQSGNKQGPDAQASVRPMALLQYLTGTANTGLSEQRVRAPQFQIEAGDASAAEANLIGPLSVTTDQTVALEYAGEGSIVNRDGTPYDLRQVENGAQLYIKPEGSTSGSGTFTAKVSGYDVAGKLVIIPKDARPEDHGQTIILMESQPATRAVQAPFNWEKTAAPPVPGNGEEVTSRGQIPPAEDNGETATPPVTTPSTTDTETPGAEDKGTEAPGAEKPGTEKPAAEKPAAEKAAGEKPGAEKPAAQTPAKKLIQTGPQTLTFIAGAIVLLCMGASVMLWRREKK